LTEALIIVPSGHYGFDNGWKKGDGPVDVHLALSLAVLDALLC